MFRNNPRLRKRIQKLIFYRGFLLFCAGTQIRWAHPPPPFIYIFIYIERILLQTFYLESVLHPGGLLPEQPRVPNLSSTALLLNINWLYYLPSFSFSLSFSISVSLILSLLRMSSTLEDCYRSSLGFLISASLLFFLTKLVLLSSFFSFYLFLSRSLWSSPCRGCPPPWRIATGAISGS